MYAPFLCLLLSSPFVSQDNWPGWRGPRGLALADQATPPVEWSEESNVRWKVPLPGKGHSSPVVWGDLVFLTAAVNAAGETETTEPPARERERPSGGGRGERGSERGGERGGARGERGRGGPREPLAEHAFVVIALDRESGEVAWEATSRTAVPHAGVHRTGTFASATPVTDGKHLIASFGSNGIYAYDLEGKLIWERDLGDMDVRGQFGEGSSPVIAEGKVVLVWDHEGDSFLVALDVTSGEELWRTERSGASSWVSPLIVRVEDRTQVVVGAGQTMGYDLNDGSLLWTCGQPPEAAPPEETEQGRGRGRGSRRGRGRGAGNAIATPVTEGGILVASTGGRGGKLFAIDLASAKGQVETSEALAWSYEGDTPNIPSPIAYNSIVYVMKGDGGLLTAYDILSGEAHYGPVRMEGVVNSYASPVAADGKVYFPDREGLIEVVQAGTEYKVLAVNRIGEGLDASPAIVGDQIFLRGSQHLYCIAATK